MATEADSYRKENRFYNEIRWALGDGLLNSQDERWKRQRRFIQPLFTRKRIAGYAERMGAEAEAVTAHLHRAARDGKPMDLHAEMSRVTLRVVGNLLFGADVERAVPVVSYAFPVLGEHARTRAYNPLPPPRSWPLPSNRRALKAQAAVRGVCDAVDRRTARVEGATGDDLMGLLIAARDGDEALDDAEIRDQVLIFLLAGHDTTAIALTFALHLLGHHREAQERVRAEVAGVAGDRTPGAADVEQLTYTTMVLKEAMRLYPPAWAIGRHIAPRRRDRRIRDPAALATSWSARGSRTATPSSGTRPSGSSPSASRRRRRPSAIATPTSRSAPARARASVSTSRCSRPRSCSP